MVDFYFKCYVEFCEERDFYDDCCEERCPADYYGDCRICCYKYKCVLKYNCTNMIKGE